MQRKFNTYNGGKAGNGTYQTIINEIPKCEIFIDAMCGNLGITSNLNLPAYTVINDIDAGVIEGLNFGRCTKKNNTINVTNLDYGSIIDKFDNDRSGEIQTVFYFDPPYLKSSRKSQKDLYKYEWTDKQHLDFLQKVLTMKAMVIISHYPCKLYNTYLSNWRKKEFYSNTRKGLALEAIYMNFKEPQFLQDYRYLGNDFIDRQRIKRKHKSFVNKFKKLPHHEQVLAMTALTDNCNYASVNI